MAGPLQTEPGDMEKLADFIRASGEPQPLEELSLRYVELLRQRLIDELAAS